MELAVDSVTANATITLLQSISGRGSVEESSNITFDLNGKTWNPDAYGQSIVVTDDGTVNISIIDRRDMLSYYP